MINENDECDNDCEGSLLITRTDQKYLRSNKKTERNRCHSLIDYFSKLNNIIEN